MPRSSFSMMSRCSTLISPALMTFAVATMAFPISASAQQDVFAAPYYELCSDCHGKNFEGTGQGTPLIGANLMHGDSINALSRSIANGFPDTGMPA